MDRGSKKSYTKRTKVVCKHPNLLFDKWLKEWRDEAVQKGSNMVYNYSRAIKSLQKFPLPLHSGKDCLVLAHFGEKICKLIDKRLLEYQNENGKVEWDEYIKIEQIKRKKANSRKRKNSTPEESNLSTHKLQDTRDFRKSVLDTSENSSKKPYIPTYRSGAYALLVALHRNSLGSPGRYFMKKESLIDVGQQYCNSSFTIPPMGSHYTAWSSMSTLTKKNLVTKTGNPAKYSLTADGKNLAIHLLSANDLSNCVSPVCPVSTEARTHSKDLSSPFKANMENDCAKGIAKVHEISDSDEEDEVPFIEKEDSDDDVTIVKDVDEQFEHSSSSTSACGNKKQEDVFNDVDGYKEPSSPLFSYVDTLGRETCMKENARVDINIEEASLTFLIKCKKCEIEASRWKYSIDHSRTALPGFVYVYIADVNAPDISPGLQMNEIQSDSNPRKKNKLGNCSQDSGFSGCSVSTYDSSKIDLDSQISRESSKSALDGSPLLNKFNFKKLNKNCKSTEDKFDILPDLSCKMNKKLMSSTTFTTNVVSSNSRISSYEIVERNDSSSTLFTMKPNTFKIILCIDNAEVVGGFKTGKTGAKDLLMREFEKHSIDTNVRKLHVGDFAWVAQELNALPGKKARELILPYVVERKRMDDLASSIRDGRFKEQKFRLKQSGLSCPIYLVEEYGTQHLSIPLQTCEQAITNTQVTDGFIVKVTADQRESAAYLTIMTRYLQMEFKNKTLHCVSKKNLPSSYEMKNSELYLGEFNELNSSSMKNKQLNVREMFAKQLLQLNGLSVDKVTAIVDKFQSPQSLMRAIRAIPSENEKELIVSNLKCPRTGRLVGPAISINVARLYSWDRLT